MAHPLLTELMKPANQIVEYLVVINDETDLGMSNTGELLLFVETEEGQEIIPVGEGLVDLKRIHQALGILIGQFQ